MQDAVFSIHGDIAISVSSCTLDSTCAIRYWGYHWSDSSYPHELLNVWRYSYVPHRLIVCEEPGEDELRAFAIFRPWFKRLTRRWWTLKCRWSQNILYLYHVRGMSILASSPKAGLDFCNTVALHMLQVLKSVVGSEIWTSVVFDQDYRGIFGIVSEL